MGPCACVLMVNSIVSSVHGESRSCPCSHERTVAPVGQREKRHESHMGFYRYCETDVALKAHAKSKIHK